MERQWWKVFFLTALALAAATPLLAELPAEETWRVWLEPKFMRTPGAVEIPGAQKTQLAGGTLTALGLEALSAAEQKVEAEHWPAFLARARRNAALDFPNLSLQYKRNKQRVIEYGRVDSPDGLVASALLAPKFLEQFGETLGPTVLVVVPNRSVAFVFPKLASNYQDYAAEVLAAYRHATWPVSLEVFELSATGLKAVGAFADPARD